MLIKCPECGADVSTLAKMCPKCGAPVADCQPERVVMELHPSWWHYWGAVLLGVLLLPAAGIGLLILLGCWIARASTVYTVTTRRVIVKSGLFSRNHIEVQIRDLREVKYEQAVLERIAGIGDVLGGTASTGGYELSMEDIPNPQELVDKLNELRRT